MNPVLVTVGTAQPFDRLVRLVDAWAAESGTRCFAQIGAGATYQPRHMPWVTMLAPQDFVARVNACSCIVSHAGMGTILTALEHEKPIIVMPKREELGETRNHHQIDTATRLQAMGLVHAAFDEAQLRAQLGQLHRLTSAPKISPTAQPELIQTLRNFIHQ